MQDKKILELYAKYDSCRVVADELGVSNETVRRCLIKHNVKRTGNREGKKRKPHIANCANRDNCYALIVMLRTVLDMNTLDIARLMGCHLSTVSNVISCRGLQREKPVRKKDVDIQAIEQDYLDGVSCSEIANKYGINPATVSKWMNELGHRREKFKVNPEIKQCACCGKSFIKTAHNKIYCSKSCERRENGKRKDRLRGSHRKRARLYGVEYDPSVNLDKLFERDNGICQICGKPCDYNDKRQNSRVGDNYPTIDHIKPMVCGGGHTWDNVQLAHMRCNSLKGAKFEVIDYAEKQTA